jgi:serine/threonine-protein kinase
LSVAVPGKIPIPSVIGQHNEQAASLLRELGLDVKIRTRQDDRPEGTVIDQDPDGGSRTAAGCKVTLTVAIPPRPIMVSVPSFIGRTEEEARKALTGFNVFRILLNLGDVTYESSEQHPGIVIDQNPKPGENVPAGSSINLVVSKPYEDTIE